MGSIDPPKSGGENGISSENDSYRKRRSSILPLEVGSRVMCLWRDSKYHPVKVIERRRVHSGAPNDYEYYVHYTECQSLLFDQLLIILCFNYLLFSVM